MLATLALLVLPNAAPPQPTDPGLVEKVTVRLVEFTFTAVDRRGNPVTDLRADEVAVLDGGVPRPLAYLRRVDDAAGPHDESASSSEGRSRGPRRVVLYFDRVSSSLHSRRQASQAARRFIADMKSGDSVMVAEFNGDLSIPQSFTARREALLASIEKLDAMPTLVARERYRAVDDLKDVLAECSFFGADGSATCAKVPLESWIEERDREIERFLESTRTLVRSIAPLPGTTSVILFSDGFAWCPGWEAESVASAVLGDTPMTMTYHAKSRRDFAGEFRSLARESAAGRVAIFSVNSGLYPTVDKIGKLVFLDGQQTLAALSEQTGGAYVRESDGDDALEAALRALSGLYLGGIYLDAASCVGPDAAFDLRIERSDIRAEASRRVVPEPADAPTLPVDVSVAADRCAGAGGRTVTVSLRVPAAALRSEPTNDRGRAMAFWVSLDAPGTRDDREVYRFVRVDRGPHTVDPAVSMSFSAPCDPVWISVQVSDALSGAMGREVREVGP